MENNKPDDEFYKGPSALGSSHSVHDANKAYYAADNDPGTGGVSNGVDLWGQLPPTAPPQSGMPRQSEPPRQPQETVRSDERRHTGRKIFGLLAGTATFMLIGNFGVPYKPDDTTIETTSASAKDQQHLCYTPSSRKELQSTDWTQVACPPGTDEKAKTLDPDTLLTAQEAGRRLTTSVLGRAKVHVGSAKKPKPAHKPHTKAPSKAHPAIIPGGRQPGGDAFQIASINFLGASHTAPGGNKPGMPDYGPRMHGMVKLIKRAGIDMIGAQEFQKSQRRLFLKLMHGRWASFPRKASYNPLDHYSENSILYDTKRIKLVEAETPDIVPYFNSNHAKMPRGIFQDLDTGAKFSLVSFHDPANTGQFPHQTWNRVKAAGVHVKRNSRDLAAGYPVINVGDANSSVKPRKQDGALNGRQSLLTPNQITHDGRMNLAWDISPNTKHDKKKFAHHIDVLITSDGIKVSNLYDIDPGSNSDHKMLVGSVTIPNQNDLIAKRSSR